MTGKEIVWKAVTEVFVNRDVTAIDRIGADRTSSTIRTFPTAASISQKSSKA
jgi:hypothetical protein